MNENLKMQEIDTCSFGWSSKKKNVCGASTTTVSYVFLFIPCIVYLKFRLVAEKQRMLFHVCYSFISLQLVKVSDGNSLFVLTLYHEFHC